jgi:hypothetical protein
MISSLIYLGKDMLPDRVMIATHLYFSMSEANLLKVNTHWCFHPFLILFTQDLDICSELQICPNV